MARDNNRLEIYLKDFSGGLVSKKVYGRTDLDLYKKGLPSMKNCITNPFGNIENFNITLNEYDEYNLSSYTQALENIKKGEYILFQKDNSLTTGGVEKVNLLATINGSKIFIMNISSKEIKEYSITGVGQYSLSSGYMTPNSVAYTPKKIHCYNNMEDGLFVDCSFLSSGVTKTATCYISGTFDSATTKTAVWLGRFMKYKPYKSTLKQQYIDGEYISLNDSSGVMQRVKKINFTFDLRKNKAQFDFYSNDTISGTYKLKNDPYYTRDYEIEVYVGKFNCGHNLSNGASYNYFDIIETPIKDTTKVDSAGVITIETITVDDEYIYLRKLFSDLDISMTVDDVFVRDNRLIVIRNGWLYGSSLADYRDFSNTTNASSQGFQFQLPLEKYKYSYSGENLIIFGNRGVFYCEGALSPTNYIFKQIDTVVCSSNIKPMAIFNGVAFIDNNENNVYLLVYNGETYMYEVNNLSLLVDTKGIKVLDYIKNDNFNAQLLYISTTEGKSYVFSLDQTEGYKFWTEIDYIDFDFSYYDIEGNTLYFKCDTTNGVIKVYNDTLERGNFYFELFKPDIYNGDKKPLFFERNIVVKDVEIMYTGEGKVKVYNNRVGGYPITIVDTHVFTDIYYRPFDENIKIAKSECHFQFGDKLGFYVESTDEYRILSIKLGIEM